MLDKLHLRTDVVFESELLMLKKWRCEKTKIFDKFFSDCFQVDFGQGKVIVFKTAPLPYFSNVQGARFEFNPCKWNSFKELCSCLSQFSSLDELEIVRIDHAADLSVSIMEVLGQMRVKFKSKRNKRGEEVFQDDIGYRGRYTTGQYFGSKEGPELICVYDKAYQMKKLGHYTPIRGEKSGEKTRIEIRNFKNKIQVKKFNELEKYQELAPFKNIQFLMISPKAPMNEKRRYLEQYMEDRSMTEVYSKFNNDNNFVRDYRQYFEESPLREELERIYGENLRQWFSYSNDNDYLN